MKGRKSWIWTRDLDQRFRAIYPHNPDRIVARELGITVGAVKSRAGNIGLRKAPGYNKMAHNINALRADEKEFIRWTYYSLTIDVIARLLGRGESTINKVAREFNLPNKPNSGCIKKGNRPPNFRMKRPGWSVGRMAETQFKKGQKPLNTLYDGAITVRHSKPDKNRPNRRPSVYIRIETKWIPYHRYVWQQHHGPVPPKFIVAFKDGNTLNCDIGNLMLMSMADNARRNYNGEKAHRFSKDLTDKYVAGIMTRGLRDKKLREVIIAAVPEAIEVKRQQLLLKRAIKNERHNKTRTPAK